MATMNKLTMAENAKGLVRDSKELQTFLCNSNAERYGENSYAIPVMVEGQEIWVSLELKAKKWYDTSTTAAFDVFAAQSEWDFEKAERITKVNLAKEKKAEKMKRQQAIKAKREAEKKAKEEAAAKLAE